MQSPKRSRSARRSRDSNSSNNIRNSNSNSNSNNGEVGLEGDLDNYPYSISNSNNSNINSNSAGTGSASPRRLLSLGNSNNTITSSISNNNNNDSTTNNMNMNMNMIGEDDEEDADADEPEDLSGLGRPPGMLLLRPSEFNETLIPSTVYFEYPKELKKTRNDKSSLDPENGRRLRYNSYWERICIKNAFLRAGFEKSEKNWTVLWSKHQTAQSFKTFNCLQKVNHFPASWALGRKDRLCRTLAGPRRVFGAKHYGFHPETYVLPQDKDNLQRQVSEYVYG